MILDSVMVMVMVMVMVVVMVMVMVVVMAQKTLGQLMKVVKQGCWHLGG